MSKILELNLGVQVKVLLLNILFSVKKYVNYVLKKTFTSNSSCLLPNLQLVTIAYTVTLHVAVTLCKPEIQERINSTRGPGGGLVILKYLHGYTPGRLLAGMSCIFQTSHDEKNQRENNDLGQGWCFLCLFVCLFAWLSF